MPRKLVVRKETLAPLGDRDLAGVAGGTSVVTALRTEQCPLSGLFSGIYPSVNYDCTRTLDELGVGNVTCDCC